MITDTEDYNSASDIYLRNTGHANEADAKLQAEQELIANLEDPRWRISNLYWIRDKEGKAVKFTPWPEQDKFFEQ